MLRGIVRMDNMISKHNFFTLFFALYSVALIAEPIHAVNGREQLIASEQFCKHLYISLRENWQAKLQSQSDEALQQEFDLASKQHQIEAERQENNSFLDTAIFFLQLGLAANSNPADFTLKAKEYKEECALVLAGEQNVVLASITRKLLNSFTDIVRESSSKRLQKAEHLEIVLKSLSRELAVLPQLLDELWTYDRKQMTLIHQSISSLTKTTNVLIAAIRQLKSNPTISGHKSYKLIETTESQINVFYTESAAQVLTLDDETLADNLELIDLLNTISFKIVIDGLEVTRSIGHSLDADIFMLKPEEVRDFIQKLPETCLSPYKQVYFKHRTFLAPFFVIGLRLAQNKEFRDALKMFLNDSLTNEQVHFKVQEPLFEELEHILDIAHQEL